jgi:hypothetical protein
MEPGAAKTTAVRSQYTNFNFSPRTGLISRLRRNLTFLCVKLHRVLNTSVQLWIHLVVSRHASVLSGTTKPNFRRLGVGGSLTMTTEAY